MKTLNCLIILQIFILYTLSAQATGGQCGQNLTWTLAGGTLTVSGKGDMKDYNDTKAPWYTVRNSIKKVIIEDGVTRIGNSTFFECTSIKEASIGRNVKDIGRNAFYWCSSLDDISVDGGNTYYISEGGVLFNYDRTTIIQYATGKRDANYTVPDGVTGIEHDAFSRCEHLVKITVSSSVTYIGQFAFAGCILLREINIPAGVTVIGSNAFLFCTSLTSVINSNPTPQIIDDVFKFINTGNISLQVPCESVKTYKHAPVWKSFGRIFHIATPAAVPRAVSLLSASFNPETAIRITVIKKKKK
ncbi:MAG: leucine-rich repeat domain-containing protein [Dysgonamonadaceae bacterium]|jgi:hypothetical protein|nr:leucine-rich repeat domain-containing protein [Dysgonamonadaceae bacterium]